jgi:hypothetical protein
MDTQGCHVLRVRFILNWEKFHKPMWEKYDASLILAGIYISSRAEKKSGDMSFHFRN